MGKNNNSKMNCALVRALKWTYFSTGVGLETEKEIMEHLIECEECRKEYESYAIKCHWGKLDVEDILTKYDRNTSENKQNKWINYYNDGQILKLSRSKAIREIILANKDSDFAEFLTKKMCQKLDHLELCYSKELKGEKNEKHK